MADATFILPSAPESEALEQDNRMITISLDPELNLQFEDLCGDRARSAVARYMIAVCLEAAGKEVVAAKYSKIGATRVRKTDTVIDE